MKKRLLTILLWILIACMILPAAAEEVTGQEQTTSATETESGTSGKTGDGASEGTQKDPCAKGHTWGEWGITKEATCQEDGEQTRVCLVCGEKDTKKYSKANAHAWGDWVVTKTATCAEEGVQTRTCTLCGKQESQIFPKTGNHTFGEWTVTREPNCLTTGMRSHQCSVCGKTENESIDRVEHRWGAWEILKEPTCTQPGKRKRVCDRCGASEKEQIKALGHEAEEWTITKEPTCRVVGERIGSCVRCGKRLTKKLNRVDHDYPEWEIIEEATDFSKGKRKGVCRFCKRVQTTEFYPEGTVAKDLENNPYRVGPLQSELKTMGIYQPDPTGQFDNPTIEAVRKVQKRLGLKADGIGWPGLIKILLGAEYAEEGWDENEGAGPELSNYKLQFEIRKTSPAKESYAAGDELTFEWTVKNTSKAACQKAKVYSYRIDRSGKRETEKAAEDIGTLKPGESASGTCTYTVTAEDAASGKFRYGFIIRGNIGGKAASNPRLFMHINQQESDEGE
jgi:hypothetical protein